ncbi:16S rRNA (cytidine(1402)-2'-O)-methyltransferase [candidate division Kazan bacterium RIFCSPHIGHO2_01_FULL_49_10]|uniref:Ribosomal RNA small subunit methyltransferase I n=1 Tax=candidate division Kazan bacterium RIFCSPLOWO2_01_FULL_48_13 TaxID=1798539 RepID=A0A1F4PNB3_UNCK3|nr:MAG: 16S rRNA (cytidine(1402)-2'-O)-methyltransferase [candidate division Kazan bacterium RIFCSPHIGHO2_01_FULL_49_10]OGB85086.1 MAG: 16S rRNA (cytidine(1402)-2'-O)-methyltransferase [candidate division Kazan bacterium RIFCSPLOWO2_01_FULL_48_13]
MGTLYIVATPIGNLEDMTLRAIRVLKEANAIACEDSRVTRTLLNKYAITTPTVIYHQHSASGAILKRLERGDDIALVTDAGTPGIQDPGGRLVREAISAGVKVVPIPGASALTVALSAAGINADAFYFLGFLPKKQGRQTLFSEMAGLDVPIVIYESPMRVVKTLKDIEQYLGNRQVVVARELTKKFEEIKQGSATELIDKFSRQKPKGEFVLIILPAI